MKPSRESLGIPPKKEVQARLARWLMHACDKTSKKSVADSTSLSLAHVTNIYNHPELHRPSLDVLICMHYGLEFTLRELLREDPEESTRAQPAAQKPSRPVVGRARKRA